MEYTRKKFAAVGFDIAIYKKYLHRHPTEYIRSKLRTIYHYHQGKTIPEIVQELDLHTQSVRKYLNIYIKKGFSGLCSDIKRPKKCLLTSEQCASFKSVLLSQRPEEVGLIGNIWTGKLMCEYLKATYQVTYKSGIYDLLTRMNLSHQRAHSDYGNASEEKQLAFLEELKNTLLCADKQTAVLKFDEFSVGQKPSNYYGWAEKNTRPTVKTDEKKESASTDY